MSPFFRGVETTNQKLSATADAMSFGGQGVLDSDLNP